MIQEELIRHGIDGYVVVTVSDVSQTPLTPERLKMSYNQGARKLGGRKKNPEGWWKEALAPFQRVYSVGKTPVLALRALGKEVGWGKLTGFQKQPVQNKDEFYYRFWANGTSMKASGRKVPGGWVVDWWK